MRPLLPTIWVSPSSCLLHHWQLIKEEVIENPLQETVQNPARVFCLGGGGKGNTTNGLTPKIRIWWRKVLEARGEGTRIYMTPPPIPLSPPFPQPTLSNQFNGLTPKIRTWWRKVLEARGEGTRIYITPPHPPPTPPKVGRTMS